MDDFWVVFYVFVDFVLIVVVIVGVYGVFVVDFISGEEEWVFVLFVILFDLIGVGDVFVFVFVIGMLVGWLFVDWFSFANFVVVVDVLLFLILVMVVCERGVWVWLYFGGEVVY